MSIRGGIGRQSEADAIAYKDVDKISSIEGQRCGVQQWTRVANLKLIRWLLYSNKRLIGQLKRLTQSIQCCAKTVEAVYHQALEVLQKHLQPKVSSIRVSVTCFTSTIRRFDILEYAFPSSMALKFTFVLQLFRCSFKLIHGSTSDNENLRRDYILWSISYPDRQEYFCWRFLFCWEQAERLELAITWNRNSARIT